jgi:hypothetical protein
MDDDGYLTVNIDYKPDQASWSAVCRDSSGSTPPSITPETLAASSLKTSVPASSGAGTTEVQDLTDQATGSAYIDIFRDTNQATSYNPGSLTAHLGSPVSLSMIGSDLFPQLFSSLLALH